MARGSEDDDLYIVEEDKETACNIGLLNFEKDLRIPLVEVLKYPYLLLNELLSEYLVVLFYLLNIYHTSHVRGLQIYFPVVSILAAVSLAFRCPLRLSSLSIGEDQLLLSFVLCDRQISRDLPSDGAPQ